MSVTCFGQGTQSIDSIQITEADSIHAGSHTFSDNPHHKPVRPSLFSEFLPFPIILPSVADPNL